MNNDYWFRCDTYILTYYKTSVEWCLCCYVVWTFLLPVLKLQNKQSMCFYDCMCKSLIISDEPLLLSYSTSTLCMPCTTPTDSLSKWWQLTKGMTAYQSDDSLPRWRQLTKVMTAYQSDDSLPKWWQLIKVMTAYQSDDSLSKRWQITKVMTAYQIDNSLLKWSKRRINMVATLW